MVDKCFAGTASRLSGVTFEMLAQEVCNYSPFSAQWHMPNQWSVYFKCKIIIIFGSLFYRHWTSTVLHFLTENVTMSSSTTRYSIVFIRSWSFKPFMQTQVMLHNTSLADFNDANTCAIVKRPWIKGFFNINCVDSQIDVNHALTGLFLGWVPLAVGRRKAYQWS